MYESAGIYKREDGYDKMEDVTGKVKLGLSKRETQCEDSTRSEPVHPSVLPCFGHLGPRQPHRQAGEVIKHSAHVCRLAALHRTCRSAARICERDFWLVVLWDAIADLVRLGPPIGLDLSLMKREEHHIVVREASCILFLFRSRCIVCIVFKLL